MGRESSDVVARADGGGRRAMRLMVVTIAIACVSHLVDATHAATMGAAAVRTGSSVLRWFTSFPQTGLGPCVPHPLTVTCGCGPLSAATAMRSRLH